MGLVEGHDFAFSSFFKSRIDDKPFVARFINQPAISSKGEVVVSVHTDLYKSSLSRPNLKIIPSTKSQRSFYPSWSADGEQIVYTTWEEDGGHIWLHKYKVRIRSHHHGMQRQSLCFNDFHECV